MLYSFYPATIRVLPWQHQHKETAFNAHHRTVRKRPQHPRHSRSCSQVCWWLLLSHTRSPAALYQPLLQQISTWQSGGVIKKMSHPTYTSTIYINFIWLTRSKYGTFKKIHCTLIFNYGIIRAAHWLLLIPVLTGILRLIGSSSQDSSVQWSVLNSAGVWNFLRWLCSTTCLGSLSRSHNLRKGRSKKRSILGSLGNPDPPPPHI